MIRRREKEKKKEFSLIISLESLINQSVWGGVEFSLSQLVKKVIRWVSWEMDLSQLISFKKVQL